MSKIKKIFSGGKPDTSALKAQQEKVAAQEAKLEAEELERKKKEMANRKARTGRSGAGSLLVGLETGVTPTDEKRGSLG